MSQPRQYTGARRCKTCHRGTPAFPDPVEPRLGRWGPVREVCAKCNEARPREDTVAYTPPNAALPVDTTVFDLLKEYEAARVEQRWRDRQKLWERLQALATRQRRGT